MSTKIALKEGQELIDREGNVYKTEKGDKVVVIKEAGQLTFDGEVVDSFYDDNKVYKAIERLIAPILKPMEKGGLLDKGSSVKKIGEEIFDFIVETIGGVPEGIDVDRFLQDLILQDDFRDEIWVEKILDPIVDAFNNEAKFGEEYYTGGDYWGDNSYIALESTPEENGMEIGSKVLDILDEYGLTTNDLIEFITDEVTSDDLEYTQTHMRAYDDNNSVTVWSSPMGEMEHQIDDDLMDAYNALDSDDAEYVSRKIGTYLKGNCIYLDLSYEVVNYFFTWKSIEDKFENWLEKTGKANLKIGASISSGDESFIEENAREKGVEIDWTILNKEVAEYELAVVSFLKKSGAYTNVVDEGHDRDDNLSVSFEVTDKDIIEGYKELLDGEGVFSFTDSSGNADRMLFNVVEKLVSKSQFLQFCDLAMYLYK